MLHEQISRFRKKPLVEALEPRLLYSADAASLLSTIAVTPTSEVRLLDDAALLLAPTAVQQYSQQQEIVFVDTRVANYQTLVDDITKQQANTGKHIEVVKLDSAHDGIQTILDTLKGRQDVSAIHLIGEGTEAQMHLGASFLTNDSIKHLYADAFKELGTSLSAGADILIYGCNFGRGQEGLAAVKAIGDLTGADIAASDNRTGHVTAFGDWTLEIQYGQINTDIAISAWGQQNWFGALSTFTVINTADTTNIFDSNYFGSLRWAISQANTFAGADNIVFNIAGTGIHTINLTSILPSITSQINIDATTDDSFVANGNRPAIVLNGSNFVTDGFQLYTGSDGSTIRGFVIQNFTQDGIDIAFSNNNTVVGNWIGTNVAGFAAAGNSTGVNIWNANNNTIGGASIANRNIISGNTYAGIFIGTDNGTGTGNQIVGNYVGTDVNGNVAIANRRGVEITSANNTIGGTGVNSKNVISGNNFEGIFLNGTGASGNVVMGNYIGTNAAGTGDINGTTQVIGQSGVVMYFGANNNRIGTNANGSNDIQERNIISGNNHYGVEFIGAGTSNNSVQGNYIGTDVTGQVALGNTKGGISYWDNASNNQVGSGLTGAGNVISGNLEDGVWFAYGSDNNKLQGNIIGLAADGVTALGNAGVGVLVFNGGVAGQSVTNNIIGTDADGSNDANERNIISANFNGVVLENSEVTGNTVAGNYIGTDITGLLDRGNASNGVWIRDGASSNMVGGVLASQRNVVSGNDLEGITIQGTLTTNNTIQGNWVGVNATGNGLIGNSSNGISVSDADNTLIGGALAGQANWVAGNFGNGILAGISTLGTIVQGNRIGTDLTGTLDWGNSENGIFVYASSNVLLGGTALGAGNIVAFNGKGGAFTSGISIANNSTDITILGNSVYSNVGIGIDLNDDNSVLPNDIGDGDIGANNGQNFPVLFNAIYNGSNTNILGNINTNANTIYRIEFFSNAAGTEDPTGYGEGRTYLGFTEVTTDGSGNANFNATLTGVALNIGDRVTATATIKTGVSTYFSTSEYAMNVIAQVPNTPPTGINGNISVTEDTDYVFTLANFGFTDTENNSLLSVTITTLPGQGTLKYLGAAFAAGNYISLGSLQNGEFTYTPPANANGNNLTSFTFQIQDNGGTANGGIDTDQSPNTITINVTPVNDAPEVSAVGSFTSIAEDTFNSAGTLVSALMGFADADAGALKGIAIQSVNNTNGQWQYTLDGTNWVNIGAVSVSNSLLLPIDAVTSVRFVPNADFNGLVSPFTFKAWDQTTGTIGGFADTTVSGGSTAFSANGGGNSIFVSAVNDAPADIVLLSPAAVNLIQNGSFETNNALSGSIGNSVANWTAIGGEGFEVWKNFSGSGVSGPAAASDGNSYLELDVATAVNGISQSIVTSAGQTYVLSFDFSNRTGSPVSNAEVYWRGNLIGTVQASAVAWQTQTFVVTGSGGLDELKFMEIASENNGLGTLLDNVRLVAAEVPAISVPENSANGTIVATAARFDIDNNDTPTYTLANNAGGRFAISANGNITVANGSLLDFESNSSHAITVRVTDSGGLSYDEIFTIQIINVNEAPTTSSVTLAAIAEDSGARIITQAQLLANANDVDGPSLTATGLAINVGSGSLVDNGNGTWTYTPALNDDTSVSFTYTITDGSLSTAGSATLDITPVNDAPDGTTGAIPPAILEDDFNSAGMLVSNFTSSATDADGTTTFGVAVFATDNSNGQWQYTLDNVSWINIGSVSATSSLLLASDATTRIRFVPNLDFNGLSGDISVRTWDQSSGIAGTYVDASVTGGTTAFSASSVITAVTITPVNDAPVFIGLNGNPTFTEGGSPVILDNNVTFYDVELAAGLDSYNNIDLVLTRNGGANTDDIFSATGNLSVLNEGGNLILNGATIGSVVTNSAGVLDLRFNASVTTSQVNEVLQSIAYSNSSNTPPATVQINWNMEDSNAGAQGIGGNLFATGSTIVNITPVNNAPTTTPVTLTAIAEDSGARIITQAQLLANASDVDGPSLTATSLSISSGAGSLVDNGNGTWTYTPTLNDDTNVSFTYTISDGSLSTAGSATLDITPDNDAPTTTPVTLTAIAEDSGARIITQAQLLANASDVDDPSLTATGLAINVGSGSLVDNGNGTWTYTPTLNDDTSVSFTYTISDGSLSTAGSANLDITSDNDAPTTTPVTLTAIAEDSGARIITQAQLLANASDVDGPSLTATGLAIGAGNGSLVDNGNGTWTYTPTLNDDTNVSFIYTITDGALTTAASANLDIIPDNDAPTSTTVSLVSIVEDSGGRLITQSDLLANATDVDSASLVATNLSINTGLGTLVDNGDGTWTYTPALNDDTSVTFNYLISDGALTTAASASLDITGINDPPTNSPVTLTPMVEDSASRLITQAQLLANATGPNLVAENLIIASGAGSLVNNGNGTWTYTPAFNDDTNVSFSYDVKSTDLTTTVIAGIASLDIIPDNDAPTTTPVTLTAIAEDSGARVITQAQLLANATDVDGPSLTATSLAISAGNGSLVDNGNGTWTYTPALNDDTNVSFTYTISDGSLSAAGSATLDITSDNDAPTTTPVTLTAIAEDSGARIITQAQLLANASDVDDPSLTATGLAIGAGNGSLVDNGNGTWTYTPTLNDDTNVSFTYTISDGSLSAAGSATLDITPDNDAPTTTPVTLTAILQDSGARVITQAELLSNATDPEGSAMVASNLSLSAGTGSLVNNGDGTWSFTPAVNDDSSVSFVYTITDGSLSSSGFSTLDITPVGVVIVDPGTGGGSGGSGSGGNGGNGGGSTGGGGSGGGQITPETPIDISTILDNGFTDNSTTDDFSEPIKVIATIEKPIKVVSTLAKPAGSVFASVRIFNQAAEVLGPTTVNANSINLNSYGANGLINGLRSDATIAFDSENLYENTKNNVINYQFDTNIKVSGIIFSAGLIAWATQYSAMLASLFASLPAWTNLDPMPILSKRDEEQAVFDLEDDEDEDFDRQSVDEEDAAGSILGNHF